MGGAQNAEAFLLRTVPATEWKGGAPAAGIAAIGAVLLPRGDAATRRACVALLIRHGAE